METSRETVQIISNENICVNIDGINRLSDNASLGHHDSHQYNSLDVIYTNINPGKSSDDGEDSSKQGKRKRIKTTRNSTKKTVGNMAKRSLQKSMIKGVLVAMAVLLVILFTVNIFLFVSSKSKERLDERRHCPRYSVSENGPPTDCLDLLNEEDITDSGIYTIRTWKSQREVQVYCDMSTSTGGWTVFQYRYDGSIEFFRNFSEYVNGFGNLETEFWLGLELIHEMISQNTTVLRIDVTAVDNTTGHQTFQNFTLTDSPDYTLDFGEVAGNMEHSEEGLVINKDCRFSAYDHDADTFTSNCALKLHGGWWYEKCGKTNLNGHYSVPGNKSPYYYKAGMMYRALQKSFESLKTSKMMFRRNF